MKKEDIQYVLEICQLLTKDGIFHSKLKEMIDYINKLEEKIKEYKFKEYISMDDLK